MGWPMGRYVCSTCAISQPATSDPYPRVYLLDNGKRLRMRVTIAWCLDCEGLRKAEDLSLETPLAELQHAARVLASVRARRWWFTRIWSSSSRHWLDANLDIMNELNPADLHEMARELDEVRERIAYLAARTAPPRCLSCSGQRLLATELEETEDGPGRRHPGCGGIMRHHITGSINYGRISTQLVHGPDGRYLHEEARPGVEKPIEFA